MKFELTKIDDRNLIVAFPDKESDFPETISFLPDSKVAREYGFPMAEMLLDRTKGTIESIQALEDNEIDVMVLTLREGATWGDRRGPLSNEEKISIEIDRILKGNIAIYADPKNPTIPHQDNVNHFIYLMKQDKDSIFYKISNDGGDIQAEIDPNSRILSITLTGNCSTGCLENDSIPTKGKIVAEFKSMWPALKIEFKTTTNPEIASGLSPAPAF